uniref:Uncharacterized protein n=1 Tax=Lepeophtheirus salmonis TaxID=72036 RepID=A0A0K2TCA3_LEPSM
MPVTDHHPMLQKDELYQTKEKYLTDAITQNLYQKLNSLETNFWCQSRKFKIFDP